MPATARYADEQGATLAARVSERCTSGGWQACVAFPLVMFPFITFQAVATGL